MKLPCGTEFLAGSNFCTFFHDPPKQCCRKNFNPLANIVHIDLTCRILFTLFLNTSLSFRYKLKDKIRNKMFTIGPLQDPVTWYGINYTGTQMTQWDFQNKGTHSSPA